MTAFYFPTKSVSDVIWNPAQGPRFPVSHEVQYPEQLTGETAGGTLYVQTKGVKREKFTLEFNFISQGDRNSALEFFKRIKKAEKVFEYEDHLGNLHSVRWTNEFNFQAERAGFYSGTIELRKEV